MQQAIVGSSPYNSFLDRRFRDSEQNASVLNRQVIERQTSGRSHLSGVIGTEVRADDLPAFASIVCDMHILASHVDFVVVMGRDVDGEGPIETVFHDCQLR